MLKGYRTIIFNAIMLAVMIGVQTGWIAPEVAPDAEYVGSWLDNLEQGIALIWGVGNVGFRFITNTPVGKAE